MGRSENSRNRIFVEEGEGIRTQAFDPSKLVDPSLIIDAMDILYTKDISTICLVTSDSDFARLANRIRESNIEVIGMGETKVHESLVQACDEFKFLNLIYISYSYLCFLSSK